MSNSRRDLLIVVALAVAGIVVYLPALRCGFVNYDDPYYVTANPHVSDGPTPENIRWALTAVHVANWHPLTWLSLQVDAKLWKRSDGVLDPMGFHLTNVLLHAANSALVFLCLRSLTGTSWRSAAVALLFCVHPLRVESVAWVTERKDVLSAYFGLLALWAYAAYVRRPTAFDYGLVALAFAASLASKPTLVTLPFLLLVLDWWPLGRWKVGARCLLEKLPLVALAAGACVVTYTAQSTGGSLSDGVSFPLSVRAGNAAVGYVAYLRQTLWPGGLAAYYPHPGNALSSGSVIASVALLAGVTVATVLLRKRAPYLLTGWLWFLGALVPVVGFVQVGGQARADRYTYIPQIGMLVAVCWCVADLARAWPRLAVAAAVAAAVALAAVTMEQIETWRDSVAVWQHDIDVTGGNRLAWYNLGSAREEKNDADAAARCYREATRYGDAVPLFPSEPQLLISLGNALEKSGRLDAAVEQYQAVCRAAPDWSLARNYLANALLQQGDVTGAAQHFEESLRLAPGQVDVCCTLGQIAADRGMLEVARNWFTKAREIAPDCAAAYCGLGETMVRQGHYRDAVDPLNEAIRRDASSARAHYYLGKALREGGDLESAAGCYVRALELEPRSREYRTALSGVLDGLVKAGKAEVARRILERMQRSADDRPRSAAGHEPQSRAFTP
jgi:pentatricopeptide repeat protein